MNNGVTWSASASSTYLTYYLYRAFNATNSDSFAAAGTYTSGVYSGSATTYVIGQGNQLGEWLQIQSNVPLVMSSYQFATGGQVFQLPKTYWIVGSNDGSTWYPIQSATIAGTFSTTNTLISTVVSIPTQVTGSTYGTSTITTVPYSPTTAYTYFRLIATSLYTSGSLLEIGEWIPTFTPSTSTGPSRTLLYMDASNVNQLDVSGSLAVVNSNASSMIVSPNTTNALSSMWNNNNNVTWQASASSTYSTWYPYYAFSTGTGTVWANQTQTSYSQTTGNWTGTNSYFTPLYDTGSAVNVNGEWLQLQSSVPLIMNKYYFMTRTDGANNYQCLLPATWKIVGSNDGTAWYSIQDASCTALPGISGTSIAQQSTSTYTITTNTSTLSQNSNANITGYSTAVKTYTYFRIIVQSILEGKFSINDTNAGNKGQVEMYFFPTFTPASSAVSLALDPATPNQLNIGGSLGIAGGITPMYTTPSFSAGQIGYMYQVNSGFATAGTPASSNPAWANAWAVLSTITVSSPGIYCVAAMCDFTGQNSNGMVADLGVGPSSTAPEMFAGNMSYYVHCSISSVLTTTSANTNIYLSLKVLGSLSGQNLAVSTNNQLFRIVRIA
jgi:hypothetical protein